jgi:hypothetical protein
LEIFDNDNGRDDLLGRSSDQSNEESLDQLDVAEDDSRDDGLPRPQNNLTTFVKPSEEQLRKTLSPLQYKVTQEE